MERLRQIRESYEKLARVYRKSRDQPWIKPLADSIASLPFVTASRVLDVGCGASANALYICSLASAQYIGLDFSFEMLKELKHEINRVKADFICGDARLLPVKDSVFSLVTQVAVIHNIPLKENRQKALKEALRASKRGGIVLITCWDRETIKYLPSIKPVKDEDDSYLVQWSWSLNEPVYRYYHFYTLSELVQDAEEIIRLCKYNAKIVILGKFRRGRYTNLVIGIYRLA